MNRRYSNSLFASTFSDGLNRVGNSKSVVWNKQLCIAKFGIGLIEFLISSTILCYGIILMQHVDLGTYTVSNGLWVTIVYYASLSIAAPWSRTVCENLEYYDQKLYRYVIIFAAIGLFIGIALKGYSYAYGIFSGIASSLITTQLKHVSTEQFNIDPKMFDCNIHCGRAISLLLMPHLVLCFMDNFTLGQVAYLHGAFLLNIIPAVLLINPPDNFRKNVSFMSRYHTLSAFSTQMREMRAFTNSGNISSIAYNESEASEDVEQESHNEPVGVDITKVEIVSYEVMDPSQVVQLNVQNYFGKVGVSILPGIAEEDEEEEDSDEDIDVINPKRLSKISNTLERINQDHQKDSIKEVFNINDLITTNRVIEEEKIENIEFIPNYKNDSRFVVDIDFFNRCCYCPPYRIFTLKRKFRTCRDFIVDNTIRPLKYSLKTFYFYPALVSKISICILNIIFINMVPHITVIKNEDFTRDDTTFCLTYMAFSWFLFLMLLPLVVTFSRTKIRLTFILGLMVNCISMLFVTRRKITTNYMILSCLLFGLGYGCVSFVENILYRTYIGARKWSQVEGTLETLSSAFVILVYYFVNNYQLDIMYYFPLFAAGMYLLNALLWTVMPVVVLLVKRLKSSNSYSLDDLE